MAEVSGNQTTTYTLLTTDPNLTVDLNASIKTSNGTNAIQGFSGAAWNVTNNGTVSSTNGAPGTYGMALSGLSTEAITNNSQISGAGGVNLASGGTVTNAAGATIQGTGPTTSGISVVSAVHFGSSGAGTVFNSGTITALGYGASFDDGGSVTNYSTGSIAAGEDAVFFAGAAGFLDNFGQLTATVDDGVGFFAGGTLINEATGTINAQNNGAAVYFANTAGTVTNYGSMIGKNYGAFFDSTETGGVVTNAKGALLQGGLDGVVIANGTVTNAGTITGPTSVLFSVASASNLLIVDPGAVFNGAAFGNGGTLELAAGTGTGVISNIGPSGNFQAFSTLKVDSGATWVLGGSGNTIANLNDAGTLFLTASLTVTTAATVAAGGVEIIMLGGTASSTTLSGVQDDFGTASGAIIDSGGAQYIASGGTASGTTVASGGGEYIWSGGTATTTTVDSGGLQFVAGTTSGTIVDSGGTEIIAASGTANSTTLSGVEDDYGTASGAIIDSGGAQYIASGGTASGTTVASGGVEYIWSGGSASTTTVDNGGLQFVAGTANGTIVEAGGTELVVSGGTSHATTLEGGSEAVSSGGIVTGIVTFVGSGELTLDQSTGPNNFQLAGFTATSDKLDLADIGYSASTTVGFSEASNDLSGTLTVSDGTNTANITLLGNFTNSTFTLSSDGKGGTIVVDPPQSDPSATTSPPVASADWTGHDSFVFKPDLGVEGPNNVSSAQPSISETDQLHLASGENSAQALLQALETNHNDWFNFANHDNVPTVHFGPPDVHAVPHPLIG